MAPTRKSKHANKFKSFSTNSAASSANASRSSLTINNRDNRTTSLASTPASPGVNELLDHLRKTQSIRARPNEISELYLSSHAPPIRKNRRIAGPPPPRSWTDADQLENLSISGDNDGGRNVRRKAPEFYNIPGLSLPDSRSLLHQSLLSFASYLDWHAEFDHDYMSNLPPHMKEQLTHYITLYGWEYDITSTRLRRLFATEDETDLANLTCTNDEISILDFGCQIGQGLTLNQLSKFLYIQSRLTTLPKRVDSEVLESWEEAAPTGSASQTTSPQLARTLQVPRFPNLTCLSLAYPDAKYTSWTELVSLSRHLGNLTKLSLAGWPAPDMTATSVSTKVGTGALVTSESNVARNAPFDFNRSRLPSSLQCDDDNVAFLLRQLSRNTPSLTMLDLSDCHKWLHMLLHSPPSATVGMSTNMAHPLWTFRGGEMFDGPNEELHSSRTSSRSTSTASRRRVPTSDSNAGPLLGPDWGGSWRRLEHLVVTQSVPSLRNGQRPKRGPYPDTPLDHLQALLQHRGRSTRMESALHAPLLSLLDQSVGSRVPESYRVVLPDDPSVVDVFLQNANRKFWLRDEAKAVLVEGLVREKRRVAGLGGGFNVTYGWDRQDVPELL